MQFPRGGRARRLAAVVRYYSEHCRSPGGGGWAAARGEPGGGATKAGEPALRGSRGPEEVPELLVVDLTVAVPVGLLDEGADRRVLPERLVQLGRRDEAVAILVEVGKGPHRLSLEDLVPHRGAPPAGRVGVVELRRAHAALHVVVPPGVEHRLPDVGLAPGGGLVRGAFLPRPPSTVVGEWSSGTSLQEPRASCTSSAAPERSPALAWHRFRPSGAPPRAGRGSVTLGMATGSVARGFGGSDLEAGCSIHGSR